MTPQSSEERDIMSSGAGIMTPLMLLFGAWLIISLLLGIWVGTAIRKD